MGIFRELTNAWKICLFDKKALKETSKNKEATPVASGILILGLAIGLYIMYITGEITVPLDMYILTVILILGLSFWLIHYIAGRMKTKKGFLEFFRPAAYSNILSVFFLLKPYLGIGIDVFIFVWSISVSVFLIREVYELNLKRTLILVGLFLLIGSVLILIISLFLGFILYYRATI